MSGTATTASEQAWCPTCGQRIAPYLWVGIGSDELRAVLDAIAWRATDPEPPDEPYPQGMHGPLPDAARVQVKGNNMFTKDVTAFKPCGHAYRWKDTVAWFRRVEGAQFGDEVCPICLPDEIKRGEAVLINPQELTRVLGYENEVGA